MSQESKDPAHIPRPLETTASGGRSGFTQLPALVSQTSARASPPSGAASTSLALGPSGQLLELLAFPVPTPGFWMHRHLSLVPISTLRAASWPHPPPLAGSLGGWGPWTPLEPCPSLQSGLWLLLSACPPTRALNLNVELSALPSPSSPHHHGGAGGWG